MMAMFSVIFPASLEGTNDEHASCRKKENEENF